MLPWRDASNFILVRFEDLVGVKGGGVRVTQVETIGKILRHVGAHEYDRADYRDWIADTIFGRPGTYRKGQAGGWRRSLSSEQVALFDQSVGDIIRELGFGGGIDSTS